MTIQLPSSGTLKMSDIKRNLEITSNANLSLGNPLLRALANKKTGTIRMSDFYASNELECLIRASNQDPNATGYYRTFWGENDRPEFGTKVMEGVYDDHPGNKFVFAVQGNQPRTTFRALVMNNHIYYEADASTFEYIPDSNTTVWTWIGQKAGLANNVVYELSIMIGPGVAAQPPEPSGTYPLGRGTDWSLVFEEQFTGVEPGRVALTEAKALDDMTVAHESTVHGINPAWSWGTGPVVTNGVTIPNAGALSSPPTPSATPVGTIPNFSVTLAQYGGSPSATAAANIAAFNAAFDALKANGGGILNLAAGIYNLGSYASSVAVVAVSDMSNVLIQGAGTGTTIRISTTAVALPTIFDLNNCSNINFFNIAFNDTGTDLNVDYRGAMCVAVHNSTLKSGYKMYNCSASAVVMLFHATGENYMVEGFDIQATVSNSYFAVGSNYNCRYSKCFLTTNAVRRAFIGFGCRDWDIVVDHTPQSTAQSNGLILLATDGSNSFNCDTVKVWATVRGNMVNHSSVLSLQNHNDHTASYPVAIGTGQTYYVSPTGNNSNPGTAGAPWATFAKAALSVSPGDTVIFEDGVYVTPSVELLISGTASQPIVYKARNKWGAIISSTSSCSAGISVSCRYNTIQDFKFRVDATNVACGPYTSANCDIRCWEGATPHQPSEGGPEDTTNHHTTIRGNWFSSTSVDRDEGVKINADYALVENNLFDNSLELYNNKHGIVRYNTFQGCDPFDIAFYCKGGVRDTQVYGNTFTINRSGAQIYIGGSAGGGFQYDNTSGPEAYNVLFYNNIIINLNAGTLWFWLSGADAPHIYNNVFKSVVLYAASSPATGGVTRSPVIKNNIFYGRPGDGLNAGWTVSGTPVVDKNCVYNYGSGFGAIPNTNTITSDPQFVNVNSDFRLQSTSPCRNTGVVPTYSSFYGLSGNPTNGSMTYAQQLAIDFSGAARSGAWSIGAYDDGTVPVFQNVKARVICANLLSATSLFQFLSYVAGSSTVGTKTTRLWQNVDLSGTVDSASAAVVNGKILSNLSTSTGAGNSVRISREFEAYQIFSALPVYFSLFVPWSDPRFVPWGVIGSATAGSSAANVRVQIRRLQWDEKRGGVWTRRNNHTSQSQIHGDLYTNYETNATAPAATTGHGNDGISVKLPTAGGAQEGSFHFYPSAAREDITGDAQELVVRFEARLILDNPSGTDDRASANILACAGGDYWASPTAVLPNKAEFAVGRFTKLTNDWRVFTAHTLMDAAQVTDYMSFAATLEPIDLDASKWNTQLWSIENDPVKNPAGVKNWDVAGGRLRLWPVQNAGTWIERHINTAGKFSQVTGYWEAKVKVPANPGIRCAVWLHNHDTTARPMLTPLSALPGAVAEGYSNGSNQATDFRFTVQPTTQGVLLKDGRYNQVLPTPAAVNLSTGDHYIGVEKTATGVQYFLDGVQFMSQDLLGPNTMTLPQYLVLSVDYQTPVLPSLSTQSSAGAFEVEQVRAWVPTTSGGGTNNPPPTGSGYVAPLARPASAYPYMTFRDEFDGSTLDPVKWNDEMWYLANNGKANIKVENSTLYMWPALPFASGTTDVNATVTTDGKFYQKYGYFEIRAKLPIGKGIWPLFFMLNHDLTGVRPEIDILETFGGANASVAMDYANSSFHPIRYGASVFSEQAGTVLGTRNSANTLGYIDHSADWHVYGAEWKPGSVQFFCDLLPLGNPITFNSTDVDMRMFLGMGLWLEAFYSQADPVNTPQGQANSLMIDYIRCYGAADNTTVVEGTVPPLTVAEGGKGGGNTNPTPKDIVAFIGNSTTWGYKTNVGGQVAIPYPLAFAQRQSTYDVRNHGVNSTQTAHWLAGTNGAPNFSTFMAANPNFKYVCLDFGTLDQFDMTTLQFKNNLKSMIATIRSVAGRIPILITPFVTEFSGMAAYVQAIRDAGSETSTAVIDKFTWSTGLVTAAGGNVRVVIPDGIHPIDQVYIDGGAYISNQWATAIAGVVAPPPPPPTNPMPAVPVGHPNTYTLTLNEEFDGSSLNTNIWNRWIWYAQGQEDSGRPVNYQVSDGALHIWPQADGNGNFSNRTIDTDGKFYQTYGFFEAEMKLSRGAGCWPAFWLFNHDRTDRPEIDIMEAYPGGGPGSGWSDGALNPTNYGVTLWIDNSGPGIKISDRKLADVLPPTRLDDSYHKYGCLVEPDGVTFFFDSQQIGAKMPTNFYTMRMYILLDLWFGSASGSPSVGATPQGISNATSTRYVRAWRKN